MPRPVRRGVSPLLAARVKDIEQLTRRAGGGKAQGLLQAAAAAPPHIATLGGAKVLNRDDIGALKPGMAADIVMFDMNQIGFLGALHDPVAALVFCTPANVACSVIHGRVVVRDGRCVTIDTEANGVRHQALARSLM